MKPLDIYTIHTNVHLMVHIQRMKRLIVTVAGLSEEYTYDTLEHHYYDVEPVESSTGAI